MKRLSTTEITCLESVEKKLSKKPKKFDLLTKFVVYIIVFISILEYKTARYSVICINLVIRWAHTHS